jgi:hypothetical protein
MKYAVEMGSGIMVYMPSLIKIFFYLVCEAIGTAATPGLLCQPRGDSEMIVEKQIKCTLCRGNKPKFSEKTCPSAATFVHHKIPPHDQTLV